MMLMDSALRLSSSSFALLFAALTITSITSAAAAAPPPPSLSDCSNLILNLADCISFVIVGGSALTPPGGCCSGLKLVIEANPDCLCDAFKNSAQFGIAINVTKAISLPDACHLSAPPSLTHCTLSNAPSAAPTPAPGAAAGRPPIPIPAPTPTPGAAPGAPSPNGSVPGPASVPAAAPVPAGEEHPRSRSSQMLLQVPVMAVATIISFAVFF